MKKVESISISFFFENKKIAFEIIWNNESYLYQYLSPFIFNTIEEAQKKAVNYLIK